MVSDRIFVEGSAEGVSRPETVVSQPELSEECLAELLDPESWRQVLKTYAGTMKLAVALTDVKGRLLGECYNPQPVWRLTQTTAQREESACPFCVLPPEPCSAVVDA